MYRPLVEFCVNNVSSGSEKVKEFLEKEGKADVIEYDCLGCCEICARTLFALVEGELAEGENEKELAERILQLVKNLSME